MLNFGASKPRVKGGGPGPRGPPWIRACNEDWNFSIFWHSSKLSKDNHDMGLIQKRHLRKVQIYV